MWNRYRQSTGKCPTGYRPNTGKFETAEETGKCATGTGQTRGNLQPLRRRENVQPVPAKQGEICNRCGDGKMCNRYRPNKGKFATATEHGKMCNRYRPNTGKFTTAAEHGKMCANRCEARENVQPMPSSCPSAGKCATTVTEGHSIRDFGAPFVADFPTSLKASQ